MAKFEFIDAIRSADFTYRAALDRNINVPESRRVVENLLWTYREDIVNALDDVAALLGEYTDKIAELEAMLDAVAKVPTKEAETESPATAPAPKKGK